MRPKKPAAETIHSKCIATAIKSGGWFIFFREFLGPFPAVQAMILSYLMNLGKMQGTEVIECSVSRMMWDLALSKSVHEHAMQELCKGKRPALWRWQSEIKTKDGYRKGKRMIEINYPEINRRLERWLETPATQFPGARKTT